MKNRIVLGIASGALMLTGCFSDQSGHIGSAPNCETCTSGAQPSIFGEEDESYLGLLEAKGFERSTIEKKTEGYLVEGDIYFLRKQLDGELALRKSTQRADNNRVNQNTVASIRVMIHPTMAAWTAFVEQALTNWNTTNSQVRFELVATNPQITIAGDTWTGLPADIRNLSSTTCGAAGFPTGGNPFPFVSINMDETTLAGNEARRIRTLTHELGHCIGLHHTNGGGGALIPGTPSTDAASLMNGGQCATGALILSPWDRISVNFLYPNRVDLVVKEKTTASYWNVANSNGTVFDGNSTWLSGWAQQDWYELFLGDANADGRMDAIAKEKTSGTWHVATSNGAGFSAGAPLNIGFAYADGYNVFTGDVNGDGRTDLIAKEKNTGTWRVRTGNGTTFVNDTQWLTGWAIGQSYDLFVADVNGDFRADLVAKEKNSGSWYVALSTGSSFSSAGQWLTNWAIGQGYALLTGDVDGDGRADLIAKEKNSGTWYVAISTGTAFNFGTQWTSGFALNEAYNLFTGDANGDGRADIIAKEKTTGTWYVKTSNGSAFVNDTQWKSGFAIGEGYSLHVGDVNGN